MRTRPRGRTREYPSPAVALSRREAALIEVQGAPCSTCDELIFGTAYYRAWDGDFLHLPLACPVLRQMFANEQRG